MPIFHESMIELRPRDRINPPRRKEPVRKMWWVVGLAIPVAVFAAFVCGCEKARAGDVVEVQPTANAAHGGDCKDHVVLDGMTIPLGSMEASTDGRITCSYNNSATTSAGGSVYISAYPKDGPY